MKAWLVAVTIALLSVNVANAKELDLRVRTDKKGEYNVALCARPSSDASLGLPGHMFVAFSKTIQDGKRTFLAIGHTITEDVKPAAAAWSYFGSPVNGYLKQEYYTPLRQATKCLSIRVNKDVFDKAFQRTIPPLTKLGIFKDIKNIQDIVKESYKLGEKDCMTYALNVAGDLKPFGLKVPKRGPIETPMAYIQRLISIN